jgi:outer membrane immunogenic protein
MRLFSQGLIGAAALGFATTTAFAADLPVKAPPREAAVVSTWTGCYLGANLGYGWGRASETTTGGGVTSSASESLNGILGGGQIGCNMQTSNIVWGIEGDFQGTDQHRTTTLAVGGLGISKRDSVPWFGTVRGRVGISLAPQWLLYATGGGGYGEFKSAVTLSGLVVGGFTTTTDHGFWTVGGGVENMFAPHWSWKLEYLYLSTGNINNTVVAAGVPFAISSKFTDNILRAGVNYHF